MDSAADRVFRLRGFACRVLLARSDQHQLFNSPRRLFRTLCRAHQLDRPARWLLVQIARAEGIDQPARLFLEPECFRREPLHPSLRGKRAAIEALAARLFPATRARRGSRSPAAGRRLKPAARAIVVDLLVGGVLRRFLKLSLFERRGTSFGARGRKSDGVGIAAQR